MDILALLLLGVMPALVIVGGLHDLVSMKIPNWISLALVAAFVPAALVAGQAPMAIALHFGVGVGALLAGMALFALRWIGGGDAKLMAASCLWLGVSGSAIFLLWTAIFGGLFCLALMIARSYSPPYLAGAPAWVTQLMAPKGDIPYGVAIAAGALMAFPTSPLVAGLPGI